MKCFSASRQGSRITFVCKNCFSVWCIHLCFRRSWWSHFGSTNRWVEWLARVDWWFRCGPCRQIKGFLIKEHISADIETKGQINLMQRTVLTAGVLLAYLQGGVPLTGSHTLGGFKAAEDNLAKVSASDALAYMRSVRETFQLTTLHVKLTQVCPTSN